MNAKSRHNVSSERARDLINEGLPLIDSYVSGEIKIIGENNYSNIIMINNCFVEYFEASVTQFERPIKFTNTHFRDCRFKFSYFSKGLIIENCVFDEYLDFQAGGHNQPGNPIIIKNSTFRGFVNFFDCWYNGEIFINDNKFIKGTNIESQKQFITFDIKPQIFDNIGKTNIEAESAN